MSTKRFSRTSLKPLALAAGIALALPTMGLAGHHGDEMKDDGKSTMQKWQGEAYQGWLDGKVETALLLNANLNSFKINTKTKDSVVTLWGTVSSEVESELAEEITKGVKGVKGVVNKLEVDREVARDDDDDGNKKFSQYWDDATTTASIKTKLLAEDSIQGLKIDVDTDYSNVTLTGIVRSDAERDLVGQIAENTEGVASVNNKLKIKS